MMLLALKRQYFVQTYCFLKTELNKSGSGTGTGTETFPKQELNRNRNPNKASLFHITELDNTMEQFKVKSCEG